MKNRFRIIIALALATVLASCLDPFSPKISNSSLNLLVVDGLVNTQANEITVILGRTQPVYTKDKAPRERQAHVTVTAGNSVFELTEGKAGVYTYTGDLPPTGTEFSLQIETSDGSKYFSDPVLSLHTPKIDSVATALSKDARGLDFYVNTHDPTGKSRLYTWDYIETYEYTSSMQSGMIYAVPRPRPRRPDEEIYRCWRSDTSKTTLLATNKVLSQDVIRNYLLLAIPAGSLKLSELYSLLVRQRVVNETEYNYLTQLKSTTQGGGGLFDPQPTPVIGNIHSGNESLPALGYFKAGEVDEVRLYITHKELPDVIEFTDGPICESFYTCTRPKLPDADVCLDVESLGSANVIIAVGPYSPGFESWSYTATSCGDCRYFGGRPIRPSFWPK